MNRVAEQYGYDERMNMMQNTLDMSKNTIRSQDDKIKQLKYDIIALEEAIYKLPPKERELTLKRANRIRKQMMQDFNEMPGMIRHVVVIGI